MRFGIFLISATLLFVTCKTTHSTDNSSANKAKETSASNDPSSPLVSTEAVPAPPPSTQTPVNSGFANVTFQDINGFDSPTITITVPKDSTITTNSFKVVYNACPQNADTSLPKDLTSCIQGYDRNLQFSIPVFTAAFSLSLQLCDDQTCYDNQSMNITNTRPLDASSDSSDIQVAEFFVQVQGLQQAIFSQTGAVYTKLKDIKNFIDNCKTTLTASQISTITVLAGLSEKDLENSFLGVQLNDLLPLLSTDFKNQVTSNLQASNGAAAGFGSFLSIYNNIFLALGTTVSLIYLLKEALDYREWRIAVSANRTFQIGGKTIILEHDRKTGFLIDPNDPCKPCTYYLEDPDTKIAIHQKTPTKTPKDPRALLQDFLVTVNPENFSSTDPKGVRYKNGKFLAYDYTAGGYLFEDRNGNKYTGSFAKMRAVIGRTFYTEYGLNPSSGTDLERNDGDTLDFNGKQISSTSFTTRKELNASSDEINIKKASNTLEGHLAGSYRFRHPAHFSKVSALDLPRFVQSRLGPLIAVSVGISSIITLAADNSSSSSGLQLAGSTTSTDSQTNTNTDICTTGVSISDQMQAIAQYRTQMALLNVQIADILGYPIQVTPASTSPAQ